MNRTEPPGDRGSMSIFTVIFSVVVFLLAGLLVDGGAAINARLRAADVAEQAARAAADQIDVEHLRATGQARLLGEGEVCAKAEEIVSAHGSADVRLAGCALGGGAEVSVSVSVTWEAFFLAAFGFPGAETEATAVAGPDAGEDAGADAGPDAGAGAGAATDAGAGAGTGAATGPGTASGAGAAGPAAGAGSGGEAASGAGVDRTL